MLARPRGGDPHRRPPRGLDGPILRARCEPFPKTVGKPPPEDDPRATAGSYACLAVTSEIDRSAATSAAMLGHPYRASLDFTSGRFALCKVAGGPIRSRTPR